jgi:hypothetical protein
MPDGPSGGGLTPPPLSAAKWVPPITRTALDCRLLERADGLYAVLACRTARLPHRGLNRMPDGPFTLS